jgi:ABC-type Fe3+-citrate transport system substrate-binding protein
MTFIRSSRTPFLGTLLAACVLLASCNGKPKDGQQNVATVTAEQKTITVASFNSLHLGWNNQKDTTATMP